MVQQGHIQLRHVAYLKNCISNGDVVIAAAFSLAQDDESEVELEETLQRVARRMPAGYRQPAAAMASRSRSG